MRRPRRNHTAGFKAKLELVALRGDKTLAELAEQFEVHANQISQWRQRAIDNMAASFGKEPVGAVSEDEVKDLSLFAKRSCGRSPQPSLDNRYHL